MSVLICLLFLVGTFFMFCSKYSGLLILSCCWVFPNESVLIRWPKCWNFSNNPSNEYSGLIFFRIDWFDLLADQEAPNSLLQHHSSKASVLRHSVFYECQLSHPYMMTGKNIALPRGTLVAKAMFPVLNMLSRLVIAFLPRSKCLLISWLQWFWSPRK